MSLTTELLASGIPADLHPRLGYRAVSEDEAFALVGYRLSGWVVPMNDPSGKPYLHNGKPFYRLKPSPGQLKGNDAPRYLSPKEGGCRPYFSPLLARDFLQSGKPLILVEGEKKADCLNAHGFPAVGLSGVDAWRTNGKPLPELDAIRWKDREVLICFDSDVTAKPSVRGALVALCLWLIEQEARPRIVLLPPEIDGSKNGADDFIVRHGAEAFRALVRIARPCGLSKRDAPVCKQFSWEPEPKPTHHKALMAWAVFKETYAFRPGFGFYRWAQNHWVPIPGREAEAMNPPMHRWMDQLGFEQRSNSVMGSIRSELAARLQADEWDSPELMAFSNGTLNVKTGEFTLGHRRDHWQTFCFPFPFDRGARCPQWESFLQSTLGDAELIQLMRAAIRWTLLPKDRHQPFAHELAFDVHGPRRSGKGTLSEVLQMVCGGLGGGVGLIKSASFSNPNALHALIGKRAAIDPDASGRISDPGVFNNVASNEPVEVKKLYADCSAERLGVVIWRFFNDQPGASGGGLEGMGRRIVPFRFDKPVTNPDRQLKAKLTAEAAGIFWWAWSMPDAEMHEMLGNAGSVKAIRQAATVAALERDPILRFLIEQFPNGEAFIGAEVLYQQWKRWATEAGHEPGSSTRFGKEIKKLSAVSQLRKTSGRGYGIEPMRAFDVAIHIGIALPMSGSEQPDINPTSNPSYPNPLLRLESLEPMSGWQGLEKKNRYGQEKEGPTEKRIEEGFLPSNPANPTSPPQTDCAATDLGMTGLMSGHVGFESNPTSIRPGLPVLVDGQPGWRLTGSRLPRKGNAVVIGPDGRSHFIEAKRISPDIQRPEEAA